MKNIFKLTTILKALQTEKAWYKSLGLQDDEQAEKIMLFIVSDDENIIDTKLVNRNTFKNYKANNNEYFLNMTRDSGYWETDYILTDANYLVELYQ